MKFIFADVKCCLIFSLIWLNLSTSVVVEVSGSEANNNNTKFLTNITQILDDLLKDYDSSQHPNYQTGTPTVIRSNIYIRSMPVSEMDMDISISAYFRQWWRDSRLSFRGPVENLSLNIKTLEKLWKPDTYFHNGKQSYIHTITVPNKLLRISQAGDILYSMRLTVKCHCLMCLKKFPFDRQSCPLLFGSYAYTSQHLLYTWHEGGGDVVSFAPVLTVSVSELLNKLKIFSFLDMALAQFDLISSPHISVNITRREGDFSVLQVNFNLERHAGYFLIQVYIPCVLIVTLSFVSFWLNREATADRVGLGVTSVLTFSTISLDSRADLPKVHYATALDWFLVMSFGFIIFTILEFATVHYFTKLGSGEPALANRDRDDEEWEEMDMESSQRHQDTFKISGVNSYLVYNNIEETQFGWNEANAAPEVDLSKCVESKETQTERKSSCFTQFLHCVAHNEAFRLERQRAAAIGHSTNSVSKIDKISRVLFPLLFLFLNICYWVLYSNLQDECERKGKQYN